MPAWLDAVRDLMVERNVVACIDEGIWGSVAVARASLANGEAVLTSWSSPHPPKTLDEIRAMTKRFSIAQLFEDEAQWFVTKAKTMPPNEEQSEQDMETYAWLDAVKELMGGDHIGVMEVGAARKAAEDAKRAAEEDSRRTADATRATRKGKMREKAPSRVTRRRIRDSMMECDEASSHDSDVAKPPNMRRKLRLADNEPGEPLDTPRGKRGTRGARAPEMCTAASSDKYENAPVKRAPDSLSSLAAGILPCLVPVERQDTELRELATQLALADLRLQYLTRAMNEDAAMLHSTIMAFAATLMRREAEEEERAALSEAVWTSILSL
ncbi:hypothetical protein EYR40_007376 [Pleurotus pulmonarius]|nr:hypothetical protein EYR36_001845 [Pleurotus pulmonarius]KAF4596926.1 hypothetical protein EYR40_007376 [Pleurotus pulmonarius]